MVTNDETNMQINITWLKSQLEGGRSVGYLQMGPRS